MATPVVGGAALPTTDGPSTDDLVVPLGDTGWTVWRWSALRGAGVPAERVLRVCDEALATAADSLAADPRPDAEQAYAAEYAAEYAAATARLTAAMRAVAADPLVREAVTWQNPGLVHDCLDKVVAGERRNARGRYHELTVTSYLQRYCLKNDTVGFFGPVGWAWLGTGHPGVAVEPRPEPLARRTTYFEHWAVAALADALADRPEVFPWLRPQREPSVSVEGGVAKIPMRRPLRLTMSEMGLLRRCDGRRTVRDLAGAPPDPGVVGTLLRLREQGVLRIDLRGPIATWPERDLAERLAAIGDPGVRARALDPLAELVAARDALAGAAGDADGVAVQAQALAATFARLTGGPATRSAGATYAGRTVAYEDTVRGVDVRVGQAVLDALAAPLGLVLDSAAWFAGALARRFAKVAREQMARATAMRGRDTVPLAALLASLMPEMSLGTSIDTRSAILDHTVAELQARWRTVLGAAPEHAPGTHLRFSAAELAERAATAFPAGEPVWADAVWHSPDIMIAARDDAALAAGDVDFVLGELHCAAHTMRSRLFTESHPDQAHQRRMIEAADRGGRFVIVPRTDWELTTPRMVWAPQSMLPSYTYLLVGAESIATPARATAVPIMDLDVFATDTELLVRSRRSGAVGTLVEVLGDILSNLACNAFHPIAAGARSPRISIDRLVVARSSVRVPAAEAVWAAEKDEGRRFAAARRWRAATGLPERVFVRVPVERKPMALDFRSLALVNVVAKAIRRTAELPDGGTVTASEMLPDLDALWLADAAGHRYTSELRLLAVRRESLSS